MDRKDAIVLILAGAKGYNLEVEVIDTFIKHLQNGKDHENAALSALWDWDLPVNYNSIK